MTKFILSCDDGCSSDVRVAELADKYDLKVTFYWPVEWYNLALDNAYAPLSVDEAYDIASKHEIGSHSLTHRHLTRISSEDAMREIWESKVVLMKMFDQPIDKFCPPRGYTDQALTEFTLKHYKSQRLTKGIDSEGYKLVHVHPNSGANDNRPWQECIKEDKIHLWMHSHELNKFNLWEELESVICKK